MSHSPTEPCRICGADLAPVFQLQLLGHIDATYHRCSCCGSLILPSPYWLDEAYSKKITPDPDQGSLSRALFIYRCIRRLRARPARIIPKQGKSLDYGSGRGLLLRLLLDEGKDAWGYDPYPNPVLAEDHVQKDFPSGPFDLVTAIEVIEHTLDPIPTLLRLKNLIHPLGLLIVSTEIYDPSCHGADWWYLAPQHGQHVTIFSKPGFAHAVKEAGLSWVCSLPWGDRPFAHVLTHPGKPISRWDLWRLQRHHRYRESHLGRDERV